MSGGDKTDITPEDLAEASGKAAATLAGSTLPAITTPPPSTTSQLDAALALLSTTIEAQRVKVDATDNTLATKQAAALGESPPNLVQQDQQGAAAIKKFPTPVLAPSGPGKVLSG
jgi:hypothetical protein